MTLRAGMHNLIQRVRVLGAAGTADFSIGGITYWSDDEIQNRLDQHSRKVVREQMALEAEWRGNGSAVWFDYFWQLKDVEESGSGTVLWSVQDSAGSVIPRGDYEVNYQQRKVTFDADTGGTVRLLTYTAYDIYAAAADIWDEKASYVASAYDVKSDNHDLKRSQLRAAYQKQAETLRKRSYYAGKISGGSGRMWRGDMA
jgi:hypothetical protein